MLYAFVSKKIGIGKIIKCKIEGKFIFKILYLDVTFILTFKVKNEETADMKFFFKLIVN